MRATKTRLPLALAALAAAIALSGCSTAPKAPEGLYDSRNKAAELAKLGDGFMAKGIYDQALSYYRDALALSSSLDDLDGIVADRASMGRAYLAAGEVAAAETEYAIASDYARMSGSAGPRSLAKAGQGEVAYAKGDKALALALFEEAVALVAASAKDEKAYAIALHDRGVAEASVGRADSALADFGKAAALNLKARRWTELGANRYSEASALASLGRLPEALAAALGALEADKRSENARAVPLDLAAAGSLSEKIGKDAEAWDYWRRSFDSALSGDAPAPAKKALAALVALAPELGKGAEGARYAEQLAQLEAAEASASKAKP
jgi:tetratricopeptide (TPR) repeat protein